MGTRAMLLAAAALPLCLTAELLPIRSYTTADGLASDQINEIVVDSRGFVWFCTPEGLSRFDGYRMVNFAVAEGLPHRSINALLETRPGTYLAATGRGLSEFHAGDTGNAFTTYLPGHTPAENAVTVLLQDSAGRIWCGTYAGLFEMLSGHKFRRQPLPAQPPQERIEIADLLEDAGHKLWVATTSGIYVVGRDGAVRHITAADGLPNEWVNALLMDKQGRVWAGTRGGLVLMRDGNPGGAYGVQQVYREAKGLPHVNVQALAAGPDGTIWAGASAGIVRSLPGSPGTFQVLTRAQGLIDRSITALATDRAGNMWAGTEGAGAMKIQPAGFTTYREQDGLTSDRVFSVLADRMGEVLAVTVAGTTARRAVDVFDGVGFRAVAPKVIADHGGWGQQQILLQSRSGEWWAASKVGLCRFPAVKVADLARAQPRACYAPDTEVFRVFEDSKGRVWASGQARRADRLLRWDPATNAISSWDNAGHLLVSAFAEDRDGAIWMGYWGGGLLRYDDRRQFTRFTSADGAPGGIVWALLVDSSGRLWVGSTGGGLGLVENPSGAPLHIRAYTTANGLTSDTIYCMVEDQAGRIYAGTAKGVDRLNPRTGDVKHFSVADGLAHGDPTAALRDAAGDLWFATKQGLSRLTPTQDRPAAVPSVRITDLRVGRDRYPVSRVGETRIRRGDLQPSQNQFQVEFVGFNDEPEESLRYKYMLEGGDSDWQGPGRDHQANYPGLEPGRYRFLVKAVNSEGRESITPAEIDFMILPPFWRRWWFETLACASLAGLIFGAHRYRVSQAVEIERMRTAIATDLHDDIGASLSQIAILSEVARGDTHPGQSKSNERMERIAALARELVDSMSDIVWSIRAEPDGVDSLIRRMREFANDLLESQSIAFRLAAPPTGAHVQLSLQARRQIFLIFKECLHNAARHSGCTAVEAELGVEGRQILLRVRDNGRGLQGGSPARTNGGSGIPSMRRRAESLGGRMQWTSSPAGGCTVEASFDL